MFVSQMVAECSGVLELLSVCVAFLVYVSATVLDLPVDLFRPASDVLLLHMLLPLVYAREVYRRPLTPTVDTRVRLKVFVPVQSVSCKLTCQ